MKDYRKFTQEKLRILIFGTEGFVFDCAWGFKELDHVVKFFPLKGPRSLSDQTFVKEISDFKPDFILTYDHTAVKTDFFTELKMPYASYFAETPFLWWLGYEPISKSISPYCVLFMWDKTYVGELRSRGFEHVFYLPLGANSGLFRKMKLSKEDREKYECDLSFAGGPFCRESDPELFEKLYDGVEIHPEGKLVIEETIELLSQNPLLNVQDILEVVQRTKSFELPIEDPIHQEMVEIAIQYEAMTKYRKEVLEAVADLGLRFYGAPEWKKVLKNSKLNYLGWVKNREELAKLYNTSRINLNTTSSIIAGALPMRAFDIPSCGGFLLTDYRPALRDFFDIDKEVACYHNKEDLREKVKYYLAHPDEREEIARRGQERVLREHTYRHRMQGLIDIMREIFK